VGWQKDAAAGFRAVEALELTLEEGAVRHFRWHVRWQNPVFGFIPQFLEACFFPCHFTPNYLNGVLFVHCFPKSRSGFAFW
jgi:hypothetical protein